MIEIVEKLSYMCYENTEIKTSASNIKDLNYSDLLSKLICEAGRWCERYSSDLFITWNTVEDFIKNIKDEAISEDFYFGFRRDGVDHNEFIESRLRQNDFHKYRSIWRLSVHYDTERIYMRLKRLV